MSSVAPSGWMKPNPRSRTTRLIVPRAMKSTSLLAALRPSEGRGLAGRLPSLVRPATVAGEHLVGALARPSQCLGASQAARLGLGDEVAPPFCLSQNAVSLHRLPETAEEVFLRFTFP